MGEVVDQTRDFFGKVVKGTDAPQPEKFTLTRELDAGNSQIKIRDPVPILRPSPPEPPQNLRFLCGVRRIGNFLELIVDAKHDRRSIPPQRQRLNKRPLRNKSLFALIANETIILGRLENLIQREIPRTLQIQTGNVIPLKH